MAARTRLLVPAVLGLGSLAFYVPRVCPTVAFNADSPEFVVAAAEWGVVHAPGYPLYTLFVHLLAKVPLGELAYRVNLGSALLHGMTIAVVAAVVLELWASVPAAVAACLCLAFSRSFLLSSLFAEAFPLNDLFCALLLLLSLRVARSAGTEPGHRRPLLHLALAIGLASAHHQFIAFGAAGILALAGPPAWRAVRREPRLLSILVAAFVLPLVAGDALLFVAASGHPFLSWGDIHDVSSLVRVVTRADYGGLLHPSRHTAVTPVMGRLDAYGGLLHADFGALLIGMSLVGFVRTIARWPRQGLGLALWWLGTGPGFALVFAYFDRTDELRLAVAQRFVTQSEVVLAVLLAGALPWIESSLARFGRLRLLAYAAAMLPLAVSAPSALALGMEDDVRGPAFVRDFMAGLPEDALVLITGDVYGQIVDYACVVEQSCGQRIFLAPGAMFMPWYAQPRLKAHPELFAGIESPIRLRSSSEIAALAFPTRPVFVVPPLLARDPGLLERFVSLPHGLLFRVYPDAKARDTDTAAFVTMTDAMARGQGLSGLRVDASAIAYPSLEVQVPLAYGAALANHAVSIEGQGAEAALAPALRERAKAMTATGSWPR
jgi:hypothetical protein